ncbi:MAG TPA: M23 family metallopeptidase [Terriglobales bacterium]|nr:M23 family metallopeptidase [Terriglobales bacterium]
MPYQPAGPSHSIRNFFLFIFFIIVLALIVAFLRGGAPQIAIVSPPKAIGMHTPLTVTVSDNMGVARAAVHYEQNGHTFPLASQQTGAGRNWWLAPKEGRELTLALKAGRADVPGLQDGPAELVVEATAANLRRSHGVLRRAVEIRSTPPTIAPVTTQHYVNQGGADMVVYTVSPGATESGVEVAGQFFRGFPMPNAAPGTMFALFAFPYDAPTDARFELVARDDAGNEARQGFPVKTFPKKYPARPMNITDAFIQQVVMAIIAHTPEISDQHDPLKNFILVNRDLRRTDTQKLKEFSAQTASQFLWHGPFTRLPAATEASFADHRFYVYHGQQVDEEYHLGMDLAGTQHMPITAANSGRVVMTQYFGIYGNTVLLDHGFGLMTLYAHMNDFAVKPGDAVQQGQLLGHSDTTGMAAGDHLHFSVLLDGVQVDPKEWWDPHWIHDRIEAKLQK